ncbi:restriction endonuclease [Paenirhodobacter hankyongi]|uniref:Restriction endonuclease n=1 Tax=Paenirhodobacter hankyongi TaxID=2294033 RepID=A0A421BM84_9RHOB|nr:hypothetical protein [Sinirhodobacter hankyongi]RLL64036.1 hypothetical protein DYS74_12475 [Sinirhodobacter hankyongi]
MAQQIAVWGIHMGEHVAARPIELGYVAIGWPELGDLGQYPDREALKTALACTYPDKKPGALPVDAGTLFRFCREIRPGDIVIYPSKHDRMVNIGRLRGDYAHVPGDPDEYRNQRHVAWLGRFPRSNFSQSALNEIGSFITLFAVREHAAEFLDKVGLAVPQQPEAAPPFRKFPNSGRGQFRWPAPCAFSPMSFSR